MILMGHRGAAALAPENTLLSIATAMEIGVNAVEIDVHLSKDKEIVVIHDATVDRTTNGTGAVSRYALNELKKLDAGKGETIPTLQEVIDFIHGKVRLVIELKEAGTEEPVVQLIKRNGLWENVYVISFWHRLVKTVKEIEGRIKKFVDTAHKEGLTVFIWNIDDAHLVKPYADMGVDGIGSNDPRVLIDFFR
jgi:glycerophosphoryl diester phosphodiesterase